MKQVGYDLMINSKMFILAINIRYLRNKSGLSLKDLASASQISTSYLNEIEKAKKYPKPEKLNSIAKALLVSPDYLTSTTTSISLKPLLNILTNNIFSRLPFNEFGISAYDFFEIVSVAPEKCSSIIAILIEIYQAQKISKQDINQSALKVYQQRHLNFFPNLEMLSTKFLKHYRLIGKRSITSLLLIDILAKDFNYQVKREGSFYDNETSVITLNANLTEQEKVEILLKEVASLYGKQFFTDQCNHTFRLFKLSYFASATLVQASNILFDLKSFFNLKKYNKNKFIDIYQSYNVSAKIFFSRLSQIIPHYFGLNQVFYIRSDLDSNLTLIEITEEIQLCPIKIFSYRKITDPLIFRKESILQDKCFVFAQITAMTQTNEDYVCISLLEQTKSAIELSCHTIGIRVDTKSKSIIQFINNEIGPKSFQHIQDDQ